jgi:hypothetical protein
MSGRVSLTLLKEKIGAIEGDKGIEYFRVSSLTRGIPRGALIELTGDGKNEWIAHFLSEKKEVKVFWIEDKPTLLPTGLIQRGVSDQSLCIAQAADNLFKAVRIAMRSQVFACFVLPAVFTEERELKTLQLLTEKANASTFLIAKEKSSFWPISVQLEIKTGHGNTAFDISVLKYKKAGIQCE